MRCTVQHIGAMSRIKQSAGPSLERALAALPASVATALTEGSKRLTSLGIRHAIAGGIAVGVHGAPRNTTDVDFLVGLEAFEGSGIVLTHRSGVPVKVGTVPVDLLPAEEPALEAALDAAQDASDSIPVIALPALIQMKLRAFRPHDQDDIRRLIRAGADLASIRQHLAANEPSLSSRLDYVLERD